MATGIKLKKKKEEKELEEATVADTLKAKAREDKESKKAEAEFKSEVDDYDIVADQGDIEKELNRSLKIAKLNKKLGWSRNQWPNLLLVGEAGTGKTSRVRSWADRHGINLFEVRAAGMDDTDLGGAITPYEDAVRRLASTEFDDLDLPDSVLFLDEYNRAPKGVRTNLLELVNSHVVPDPRVKGKQRRLENFLFTVAAINPYSEDYDTDKLDDAELDRFRELDTIADPVNLLNYLDKKYSDAIKSLDPENPEDKEDILRLEGLKSLANALLSSKDFEFDSIADMEKAKDTAGWNGRKLFARSFEGALELSDGTKDSLLAVWDSRTNNLKKPMVQRILANYKDVDDKANDALKAGTNSKVFGAKEKDNVDKIIDQFGDIF